MPGMHKHIFRDGRAGFSLIEVMMVVVLIGIMAAIAAPSLSGYVDRSHARSAADRVRADIGYARMLAVRHARPTVVRFVDASYTISTVAANDAESVVKRVNLGADHGGAALSPAGSVLRFDSRGLLRAEAGEYPAAVLVTRGGASSTLVVLPTGRIYQ